MGEPAIAAEIQTAVTEIMGSSQWLIDPQMKPVRVLIQVMAKREQALRERFEKCELFTE